MPRIMYRINSVNQQQPTTGVQQPGGGGGGGSSGGVGGGGGGSGVTVTTSAGHLIIQQHGGHSSTTQIISGIPAGGGGGGGVGGGGGGNANNNGGTSSSSSSNNQQQLNGNNLISISGNNTICIEDVKMLAAIKSEPTSVQQDIKPLLTAAVAAAAAAAAAAASSGQSVSSVAQQQITTVSTTASAVASTSTPTTNGHMIFVPAAKRTRLDGPDDWLSSPSPGSVPSSAPPLSPSPGSQSHNFNTSNMSNGYASPMSTGSYDPYSPGGKMGREDLSPSSSLNGYSTNDGCDSKKSKKGPAPRLQEELCLVCGDRASGYHYNALTCEGCKGFFRRSVTKNAVYCCKFGHACEMDMYMRRKCQECRLKKCLAVGMRPECVVPENQCAMKRKEKKAQKERDKQQISPAVSTTDTLFNEILQLMKCEPPPHAAATQLLPEKLLAENRARNIPPLTLNQLAVIYKLIWYQDGYEQPSEEDLKRIMISSPDENESQHDISFRHITEITILTVQLIVEFAKGLPAFNKIPQEDQITLLKACSSEVMMLRMARRYDAASDSIFFANNRSYTRESYKMAGMADNIEDLLHFCRQMYSMTVDNVEYALLTAIVIFSDRPGLEEAELVEAIQSYYIDTLRIYILNRHGGDSKSLVFFAKLLSILTELRTLGNQNAEMCFSLKLKNRKLPRFLEEIWDVHSIPPQVQSHLEAQQAAQQQQEQRLQQQQQQQQSGNGLIDVSVVNNSGISVSNDVDCSTSTSSGSSSSSSTSSSNNNCGVALAQIVVTSHHHTSSSSMNSTNTSTA